MHNYKKLLIIGLFITSPLISAEKIQFKNWAAHFLKEHNGNSSNALVLFLQERKNKASDILKQKVINCQSPASPSTPRSPINVKQQTPKVFAEQPTNPLKAELLVLRTQKEQEQHYYTLYRSLLMQLVQMMHASKIDIPLSDEIDQFRYIEVSKKFAEAILEQLALTPQ